MLLCLLIPTFLKIRNGSKEDKQRILGGFFGFLPGTVQTLPTQHLLLFRFLLIVKDEGSPPTAILEYYQDTQSALPLPKKRELTEFTVFGDSSFAPSGRHSQAGFTIHFSSAMFAI